MSSRDSACLLGKGSVKEMERERGGGPDGWMDGVVTVNRWRLWWIAATLNLKAKQGPWSECRRGSSSACLVTHPFQLCLYIGMIGTLQKQSTECHLSKHHICTFTTTPSVHDYFLYFILFRLIILSHSNFETWERILIRLSGWFVLSVLGWFCVFWAWWYRIHWHKFKSPVMLARKWKLLLAAV